MTAAELAALTENQLGELCKDQWWRLNHLYWIQDEMGNKVLFRFNRVQQQIFDEMWFWNIYLKSRQHGVTTFWCIYALDTAIFNSNQTCNIIAHKQDDAKKIFRKKVRYPFDNLNPYIKGGIILKKEAAEEYIFDNDSSIAVSVSARSDTSQILHISEFGYTCAKHPEKAAEIVSGALNTAHPGSIVSIESTAMGKEGEFYEYCVKSAKAKSRGTVLSKLDFRFHFYAWWRDPKNALDPKGMVIYQWMQDYFKLLQDKYGIVLSAAQKAWYIAKQDKDPNGIKREHPSFWKEAFEASLAGAYWASQFQKIYKERRIGPVAHDPAALVNTYWDIGKNNKTAIWFEQSIGNRINLIDYFEGDQEGLKYYRDLVFEWAKEKNYEYGRHWAPHDIKHGEWGSSRIRLSLAESLGLHFDAAPRVKRKIESIEASRMILDRCWFDEERCETGISHLEAYRREWDRHRGTWKDEPYHNDDSDGADAFQVLAMCHPTSKFKRDDGAPGTPGHKKRTARGWT